jgi:outer membrane protein assembly factor BamB
MAFRTYRPAATRDATVVLLAAVLAGCSGTPAPDTTPTDAAADPGPTDLGAPDVPTDLGAPDAFDAPADLGALDAPADLGAPDAPPPPPSSAVITHWGYDAQRTLANRHETVLTVAAVSGGHFGRDARFAPPTFDGPIYTQPLYLANQTVGGAMHDVLFVATVANTVYALDARTGAMLWHTNVGAPAPRSSQLCGTVTPSTGILSGPVIDPATGTLYAVALTTPDGGTTKVFTVNALDVTTGTQRAGYPQPIRPPVTTGVTFNPETQQQRAALSLLAGRLFVPFGALGGAGVAPACLAYNGWLVGIDVASPTQQRAFVTPDTGGGIWAPSGLSTDGTNLFVATGNGASALTRGDTVLRLAPSLAFTDMPADYFAPSNRMDLDGNDLDVGSVAPVLLPDHTGSSTPHLLLQGGKAGVAYLLNRDNLGGMAMLGGTDGVFSAPVTSGAIIGGMATWTDGTAVYGFVPTTGTRPMPCTGTGGVVALRLGIATGGASTFGAAWCSAVLGPAMPAVSSNGNADGILWVAATDSTRLRAYAIATGMEIFAAADAPTLRRWVAPLVADGRVYATGTTTVAMYQLLP